jgi:hypothetical protein
MEPTSMDCTHRIHKERRELRRKATDGVFHEVEEERHRGEARSGHHATVAGRLDPATMPPDLASMAHARRIRVVGGRRGAPPW